MEHDTNPAEAGKRCRGSSREKRAQEQNRPSRARLLLCPEQRYLTFGSCFQVQITFLSNTLQERDKRDLVTSQQCPELQGKEIPEWGAQPPGMPRHSRETSLH